MSLQSFPLSRPDIFTDCLTAFLRDEGGELDLTSTDPGNWTGGEPGEGLLEGSQWGISSASYPGHVPCTREQAAAIYEAEFWPVPASLPAPLRWIMFTTSGNSGTHGANVLLQDAAACLSGADLKYDGIIGSLTRAAIERCDMGQLVQELIARRIILVSGCYAWRMGESLGLARRLSEDAAIALLPPA